MRETWIFFWTNLGSTDRPDFNSREGMILAGFLQSFVSLRCFIPPMFSRHPGFFFDMMYAAACQCLLVYCCRFCSFQAESVQQKLDIGPPQEVECGSFFYGDGSGCCSLPYPNQTEGLPTASPMKQCPGIHDAKVSWCC